MLNKKIVLISIAVLIVGIFAMQSFGTADGQQPSNNASRVEPVSQEDQALMHQEYPGVPENNRYVRNTYNEIIDRFRNGTGVIFLGFKECPWCQQTTPVLNEAALAEETNIHYLDIRQLYSDNYGGYEGLLSYLAPHLPKNEEGLPRISTPDISFVKDGEIVWRFKMDPAARSGMTPTAYWTDERKKEAVKSFRDEMKKLKEE